MVGNYENDCSGYRILDIEIKETEIGSFISKAKQNKNSVKNDNFRKASFSTSIQNWSSS